MVSTATLSRPRAATRPPGQQRPARILMGQQPQLPATAPWLAVRPASRPAPVSLVWLAGQQRGPKASPDGRGPGRRSEETRATDGHGQSARPADQDARGPTRKKAASRGNCAMAWYSRRRVDGTRVDRDCTRVYRSDCHNMPCRLTNGIDRQKASRFTRVTPPNGDPRHRDTRPVVANSSFFVLLSRYRGTQV